MTKAVQLLTEALDLPEDDRALIARELVLSLETDFGPNAKQHWASEILRRSDALHRKSARVRDARTVIRRIRSKLRRRSIR